MLITIFILIIATAFFIHGRIKADLIAVGALLALILFGIITPLEALAGFSNSVVIMIAGLFIVGAGIFNTGLAKQMSNHLLKLGKGNETKLLIIIMITVGVFSAFMSNTGTVAVMLPVVVSMALSIKISPAKFLIPLAFASSLGGVLTLIGTPPNLVASNVLAENGYEPMRFFQFTPIGLVTLIAGVIFMATIGKRLLPNSVQDEISKNTSFSANKLAGVYKIYHSLHLVKVPATSSIVGKQLHSLELPSKYGITVIAIKRDGNDKIPFGQNNNQVTPKAHTIIKPGDVLLVLGQSMELSELAQDFKVKLLSNQSEKEAKKHFLSRRFGIAEVIITPQSSYQRKSIRELHFRKKFGLTALAINRNGKYIRLDVGKEKLRPGDAILIHGEWEKIELLAGSTNDVVVVGKVLEAATTFAASGKAPIAGSIMLFMLVLMTLELLDPVVTVLISAFLMLITGCLRSTEDAYRAINWESIILIAAMLPMATALEKTGGVQFISDVVLNSLGDYGPFAVLAGFYILTMVLSQFISNTATAVIFAPIAITAAINMGVSPYPFIVCVAIAASMAFSTPVASPTNALVMNAGGYKFKDFVKLGVPLQLFLAVVTIIAIPVFFPF